MKALLLLVPYLGVVGLGGFQASFVVFCSTHESSVVSRPAVTRSGNRDQEIVRLQERLTRCTKQLDAWHDRYGQLPAEHRAVIHGPLNDLERRWIVGSHRLQALKYVSSPAWTMVRDHLEEVLDGLTTGLQRLQDSTALAARCSPPREESQE